jgi:SAM-dependent methyltransferase
VNDRSASRATYYERVAETRWGQYLTDFEADLVRRVLDRPPGSLLEIGCDAGRWLLAPYGRGWKVAGSDVNAEALAEARARMPAATFHLVSPEDRTLPAEDGSVDVLLAIEVPYVTNHEWFLAEAGRVLADGGKCGLTFHNRRSWRGLIGSSHFYLHSFAHFRKSATEHGLAIESAVGGGWAPFHRSSDHFLIPALTRAERLLHLDAAVSVSPLLTVVLAKRRSGE